MTQVTKTYDTDTHVLVPRAVNDAMASAWFDSNGPDETWRLMIAAAPQPVAETVALTDADIHDMWLNRDRRKPDYENIIAFARAFERKGTSATVAETVDSRYELEFPDGNGGSFWGGVSQEDYLRAKESGRNVRAHRAGMIDRDAVLEEAAKTCDEDKRRWYTSRGFLEKDKETQRHFASLIRALKSPANGKEKG